MAYEMRIEFDDGREVCLPFDFNFLLDVANAYPDASESWCFGYLSRFDMSPPESLEIDKCDFEKGYSQAELDVKKSKRMFG